MRSGNISVFKPLLELAIAAAIINELDKKNAMNKQAEYTPLNRQERKTELERYQEFARELENKTIKQQKQINELENIIEAHLIGWCIVAIGVFCIAIIELT